MKKDQDQQQNEEQSLGSRFGRKKNKKGGDDDESPIRLTVREFIEGKYVTFLMFITTIYALFGDDIRLWFTDKNGDPYFFGFLSAAFILFSVEILVNCCVVDDYKYSFFFWLDIIATLSLISDI